MKKVIQDQREWTAAEPELGSAMDTLRVEAIGYLPAKTEPIHAHFPFDGLGIILKGSGFYRVDEGPVRVLRAPAVFFIWPGPRFHYGPDAGSSWAERYLCFTGARVADWLRWGWLARSDRPLEIAEPDALEQMHRHICRAFAPFGEFSFDRSKMEIEQLIHELHRQALRDQSPEDKLSLLIRRWIKDPTSAGDLPAAARKIGMSYSGFRQHFARRTGLSSHQFLLRLQIDRACLRLAQSGDPVKAVAADCGFAFVESFNRAFRRVKGITPGEYRRRTRLLTRSM